MQEIRILTNINTNSHYTFEGKSFEAGNPIVAVQSNFIVYWQLYKTTPNANADDVNIAIWEKARTYSGCNAKLTCDDSWATRIIATLNLSGDISKGDEFPENIVCNVSGVMASEISATGEITIYNNEGAIESLYYHSYVVSENTVSFHVGQGVYAKHNHVDKESCFITQSSLFSAYADSALSSPADGLFVFKVFANSNKLQKLKDQNDSGIIPVVGMEILPYIVTETGINVFPAFLFDGFTLATTLGHVGVAAELGEEVKDSIFDEVNSLVSQGFTVQIYNDTTNSWEEYYENYIYSAANTKYRFRLKVSTSDSWVEVPIIMTGSESYIDVTEVDPDGNITLETSQVPVAITIDGINYDFGNCPVVMEEKKCKFLASYFLAKANEATFSPPWRVWLSAKDGKPGDPGKSNYVFCLCQSTPPALFDGLIWVVGGTHAPKYISVSGGLNIKVSEPEEDEKVPDGTIVIDLVQNN